MADAKISQLTALTSASSADLLPIVENATTTTKKITWANLQASITTVSSSSTGVSNFYGASGMVLNIASSNWVATHTSGILTVGTGDLRITTAGTNSASVVTVGGTQTLTNKSISIGQITGLGTGIATWLATPSSANLISAITDETGTGLLVFNTSPSISTSLLMDTGFVFNIASSNWVATHTSGILTVGTGDLRVSTAGSNSASVVTVGGTQTLTNKSISIGQITGLGTGISTWLATPSSANLASAMTDETGSGALVFATSPSLSTSLLMDSGFVFNIASSNWVATHSSGILTVGTGDLRVTTAGSNAASVVTVGGTQTLTNKTLTTPTITTPTITGATTITIADTTNVIGLTINPNDTTNYPLALRVGPTAAKVTTTTLVQYNDSAGNYSDWSFHVSGGGIPVLNLQSSGGTLASPTATTSGNNIGEIAGYGYNSSNAQKQFTEIDFIAATNTASSEEGKINLKVMKAGILTAVMSLVSGSLNPVTNDLIALGTGSLSWSDLFMASGAVININNGNWTATHSSGILTIGTSMDIRMTTAGTNSASVVTVGGTQTLTNKTLTSPTLTTPVLGVATGTGLILTGTSANILTAGANGSTNPVFNVDASASSVATGINIAGAAAASRAAISVLSSGTNEGLSIDAKGSGTIRLGATSTGAVEFSRNAVPTSSDGAALGTTSLQWSDIFLASGAVLNYANGDVVATHSTGVLTVGTGDLRVSNAGSNSASVTTVGGTQTLTNKTLTSPTIQTSPVLAAATQFKWTIPTSDDTCTGITTNEFNAGYTTTLGDLVYLDSNPKWQKTDANAASTYKGLLGIVQETGITNGNPVKVLLLGWAYHSTAFPTFTIGGEVYMSETAGAVTQTAPTTTDATTRILGFAIHADKMWFNPANNNAIHT